MYNRFSFGRLEKTRLWLLLINLLLAVPVLVKSQPIKDTLFIKSNNEEYPVSNHLYIYKTDKALKPGFIYNLLNTGHLIPLAPHVSYHDLLSVSKYYWLVFTIENNLSEDKKLYYKLNSQQFNVVKAYQKTENSGIEFIGLSGADVPFNSRAYPYYDVVFPLLIKARKTTTVILSLKDDDGDYARFLPQLLDEKSFKGEEEHFYTVNGIITGIMLTVFLLNFLLGIALRERLHFLYGIYILVALYDIYSIKFIDVQYIYPDYPQLSWYLEYIMVLVGCILMTLVMQAFLNQKKENSKIKKLVDIVLWLLILMIPLNAIIFFPSCRNLVGVYEMIAVFLLMFQFLLLIASGIEKTMQGNKTAWFYLTAMLFFIIGLIEYMVMILGGDNQAQVLKHTPTDIEIGIIIETIVVFLGIAYRYNLYKKEKENLLIELNIEQQTLIEKIVSAEEAERKRIAQDLHDDVGATLSTLSMFISNAKDYMLNMGDFEKYHSNSILLSKKAVADIRNIAHNLLPKDFSELGLFSVLKNRIEELNTVVSIRFMLITEGDEKLLSEVFSITVYRIINELLSNICKHSLASDASIQILIEGNNIQIIAEDDGIGFDSEIITAGIGLKNIKRRIESLKGTILFDSNQDGAQTIIQIPL